MARLICFWAFAGDRLLVVDCKRSKSTSRRSRMEKATTVEPNLYRAMLESGGPKDDTGRNAAEQDS